LCAQREERRGTFEGGGIEIGRWLCVYDRRQFVWIVGYASCSLVHAVEMLFNYVVYRHRISNVDVYTGAMSVGKIPMDIAQTLFQDL
jgi:hypothetical protein